MLRSRKRLTVGLMMILVAIVAVAFWAFQYLHLRRTRLTFENLSSTRIPDVTVTFAGWTRHLGAVEPFTKVEWRLPNASDRPTLVEYDVPGRPGEKATHVTGPAFSGLDPGQEIHCGWGGKYGPPGW